MHRPLLTIVLFLALALAGCGGGGGDRSSASDAGGSQTVLVTGIVLDGEANPLQDAVVTIHSDSVTTRTDREGFFELEAEIGDHELTVAVGDRVLYHISFSLGDSPVSFATWHKDADGDGYSDGTSLLAMSQPTGYFLASDLQGTQGECDDGDDTVYPGAVEACNGIDDDCDGEVDEGVTATFYRDGDGDGFGTELETADACAAQTGYVARDGDCDDADDTVYPGADELYDQLDNDCDEATDEGWRIWYKDRDGDGYSDGSTTPAGDQPVGYAMAGDLTATSGDCNDDDVGVHPGMSEVCNGVDENCDGAVDEGVLTAFYVDNDKDGYGQGDVRTEACARPDGYAARGDDCDDRRADVHPGADEAHDGIDNNCDGEADEGWRTWYKDADVDGYSDGTTTLATGQPQGYAFAGDLVATSGDCNDDDANVHPGMSEACNGVDDNCSGAVDEGVLSTFYLDADEDGHGDGAALTKACTKPQGYVVQGNDCNDGRADVHPGAEEAFDGHDNNCDGQTDEGWLTWYKDADVDGYSDGTTTVDTDRPDGYSLADNLKATSGDCDDTDAAVSPEATEICNGMDDDCNGVVDEGVTIDFYRDNDADGYGTALDSVVGCSAPQGYVADATDCDDADSAVRPGATERCDGVDNDCDGTVDLGAADAPTWYADGDGDGYGGLGASSQACTQPTDHVADSSDCDDADGSVHPGASEHCDGKDDDCDGLVDEEVTSTFFLDFDGDLFGNPVETTQACTPPAGYVSDNSDCNDARNEVYPGAPELCDGDDNDCDDAVDEGVTETFFLDSDGDGFGDDTTSTQACTVPEGYAADGGDCDDSRNDVNPGASELCDGADNDCDGTVDMGAADASTWYADTDGDGFGDTAVTAQDCAAPTGYVADDRDCDDDDSAVHPAADELCGNGVDEDCSGEDAVCLPDTGQTQDYSAVYGEDSDYLINEPSYTDNGDGTVTDNVTGLMWQQDDDALTRRWDAAVSYCENLEAGGNSGTAYADWRLPTRSEIVGILNYGDYFPALDTTYFSPSNSYYWSASSYDDFDAWFVLFSDGRTFRSSKQLQCRVRCVRGGEFAFGFVDNGDGTITDRTTGLRWQQDNPGALGWDGAVTFCESLALGGHEDWRLPNIKELESIVMSPAAPDPDCFTCSDSSIYWSSTSQVNQPSEKFSVDFETGVITLSSSINNYNVRCVRGGIDAVAP